MIERSDFKFDFDTDKLILSESERLKNWIIRLHKNFFAVTYSYNFLALTQTFSTSIKGMIFNWAIISRGRRWFCRNRTMTDFQIELIGTKSSKWEVYGHKFYQNVSFWRMFTLIFTFVLEKWAFKTPFLEAKWHVTIFF